MALDLTEEPANLRQYRNSIISIPRKSSFVHRGSVVASHLDIPEEEINNPEMIKAKLEISNPVSSVLKEMMDFEIMLNPLFVLICISNILGKPHISEYDLRLNFCRIGSVYWQYRRKFQNRENYKNV